MGMSKNPSHKVGRIGKVNAKRSDLRTVAPIKSNGKHLEGNMVTGGKTVYPSMSLPVAKSALGTFGK
jgi:hypothetical protein